MDSILKQQPKDNWDSFPLFQIINDYLITDGEILTLSPKETSWTLNEMLKKNT